MLINKSFFASYTGYGSEVSRYGQINLNTGQDYGGYPIAWILLMELYPGYKLLLMYGEALNELDGPTGAAYAAINSIRRRARMNNPHILPEGLTREQFREAILWNAAWNLLSKAIAGLI